MELNDIYRKYHAQKLCMKELYKNNLRCYKCYIFIKILLKCLVVDHNY